MAYIQIGYNTYEVKIWAEDNIFSYSILFSLFHSLAVVSLGSSSKIKDHLLGRWQVSICAQFPLKDV